MKRTRITSRLMLAAFCGAATLAAIGCQQSEEPKPQPAPVQEAAVAAGPCAGYRPAGGPGWNVSQMAFPTGDTHTSAILLSTVTPSEVNAGATYSYQLHVTNLTSAELQSVNLTASKASNLDVTASKPEGSKTSDGWTWNLGNLAACETRVIELTGRADKVGISANCLAVSYNNLLCTAVKVTQPALAVTKSAPAEVMICDPIPYVFEVRNTGTGVASGVKLSDSLPAGLMTIDGQSNVTADVGDLAPGQAKRVTVQTKAAKTGTYVNTGSVTASGNLSAKSNETSTVVRQPVLALTCQSPERIFLGRDTTFTFVVKNTGDGISRNTTVSLPLPAGATYVSSTEGGTGTGSNATWNIGDLAAGASKTVAVTVRPTGISTISTSATAQGVCAAPVTANCATSVQGIPAILLEMVDDPDPVMIGDTTTYTIRVTNQGSAVGTGIKVALELPPEIDFVSQSGVTAGTVTANGRTVNFAVLPSLNAKAVAEWKVVVKANAAKDIRTKATVVSDQFSVPLEKLESTNLYK